MFYADIHLKTVVFFRQHNLLSGLMDFIKINDNKNFEITMIKLKLKQKQKQKQKHYIDRETMAFKVATCLM